jgi:hypothetical protein
VATHVLLLLKNVLSTQVVQVVACEQVAQLVAQSLHVLPERYFPEGHPTTQALSFMINPPLQEVHAVDEQPLHPTGHTLHTPLSL